MKAGCDDILVAQRSYPTNHHASRPETDDQADSRVALAGAGRRDDARVDHETVGRDICQVISWRKRTIPSIISCPASNSSSL